MQVVSVVLPEKSTVAGIADTVRFFTKANEILKTKGQEEAFKIQTVCFVKNMLLDEGKISFTADCLLEEAGRSDLIIVPSITGDVITATQLNRSYISWLIAQHNSGAEIGGFGTGNFLLAAASLLNGGSCTTHWMYAEEFSSYFPDIRLADDKIITERNGVYTCGGGIAYWTLLLHLLAKFTSRELTFEVAKYFLLESEWSKQEPFAVFSGQKKHNDVLVKEVQLHIEERISDKIGIDELAKIFCVTRRTLERRFKDATSETIGSYIQKLKIEVAKKALEEGSKSINDIMYELGYSDGKAFRHLFMKFAGIQPAEYRNKYLMKRHYSMAVGKKNK